MRRGSIACSRLRCRGCVGVCVIGGCRPRSGIPYHPPCQSPPVLAPRNCPVSNCVKAAVALPSRELCRKHSAAIGDQELDLLGKKRIAASGEPHGAIGAVRGAELLRMATAKEQRLLSEPKT